MSEKRRRIALKKLKLKGKLALCFCIAITIATMPAFLSVNRSRTVEKDYNKMINECTFVQEGIMNVLLTVTEYNNMVHNISAVQKNKDSITEKMYYQSYDGQLKKVSEGIKDDKIKKLYKDAVSKTEEYFKTSKEILKVYTNDNSTAASYEKTEKKLVGELEPLFDKVKDKWNVLLEELVEKETKQSKTIEEVNFLSNIFLLGLLVISAIIAIIFCYSYINKTVMPVKEVSERLKLLATKGDLKAPVLEAKTEDEIGDLSRNMKRLINNLDDIIEDEKYLLGNMAEGNFDIFSKNEDSYVGDFKNLYSAMNTIKEKLSATLREIDVASEHVSVGSEQVASGAQELAQGATEQASAIEQLTSKIESIAQQIKENAKNAKNANEKKKRKRK